MIPTETINVLEEAFRSSNQEPIVIFKHSLTCGISARARVRLQEMTLENDPKVYEVVVQQARDLSNEIASRFGIRHESPQAIVVYEGKPLYHASHGRIRPEDIREAVSSVNNRQFGRNA